MNFELYLIRYDGGRDVKKFTAQNLEEAWNYAASFMGRYKAVEKMVNLSAVREQQLRGNRN